MWNFDPSWPASANEMTLAAQLLACTSYIRSLWSASDEEHQWRRDEVEDALAQLARQEEVALPPTLRDLARHLANIQQLPRGAAEALLLRIEEEAKGPCSPIWPRRLRRRKSTLIAAPLWKNC